uniref:Uncharacterized protein n=1 Tax=Aegilops tauschii subsp. strangulata TaxID=200361 RepID=A0A453CNA1_AEGTS
MGPHGAVFAIRFFHPSANSATNSRILLSSMPMLMSALKQLRTYDTLRPSISTGMEKG